MESQLIQSSPEILSGTPVFSGTRVPIQTLIDYLEAGESASLLFERLRQRDAARTHTLLCERLRQRERLDEFLEDFPTVSRAQATTFLKLALRGCLKSN